MTVDFVNTSDLAAAEKLIRPETRALYIETPSNPMMHVTDIRAAAALAHAHGMMLIADNTFLSPYFQNPLTLGADIVVHSGSKFIAGHNDAIAGFACSAHQEIADRIRLLAKTTGGTESLITYPMISPILHKLWNNPLTRFRTHEEPGVFLFL